MPCWRAPWCRLLNFKHHSFILHNQTFTAGYWLWRPPAESLSPLTLIQAAGRQFYEFLLKSDFFWLLIFHSGSVSDANWQGCWKKSINMQNHTNKKTACRQNACFNHISAVASICDTSRQLFQMRRLSVGWFCNYVLKAKAFKGAVHWSYMKIIFSAHVDSCVVSFVGSWSVILSRGQHVFNRTNS